jgi:glutamyl-tRNA(Gln) amidotransferase subunit D
MHSTRRDAFKSIEEGPLATYCNGRLEVNDNHRQLSEESDLDDRMDTSVMMTYFYPGLSASDFESMSSGKKAVVIMGTGLGHIADDLLKTIRTLSRDGTEFLMTTQCIYGRVNPFIYSTGRNLKDAGVTYLGDMLSEVAYVKAMHVLGSYPREQFREIMTANMRGEIRERLRL